MASAFSTTDSATSGGQGGGVCAPPPRRRPAPQSFPGDPGLKLVGDWGRDVSGARWGPQSQSHGPGCIPNGLLWRRSPCPASTHSSSPDAD
ncbi:hypothetical protein CapIbe_005961 [Capra ibex]